MRFRSALTVALVLLGTGLFFAQNGFRRGGFAPAGNEKAEYYWSRLRYTPLNGGGGGFGYGGYGGGFGRGNSWSTDYPKADRQFLLALTRLTRVQTRSTEQVVDLDTDGPTAIENYPWVYAVQVQNWTFTAPEAQRLHDYLMKGGFLFVDDFHGTEDWEAFLQGMNMVLPGRPIEDLSDNDEIFHVLYDLGERFQVPGDQFVRTGRTYEKDGYVPKWRAIRDDDGRVMVAICHNMHLGDAWEWADSPQYPERYASLAFRVGINYVIYGMTH